MPENVAEAESASSSKPAGRGFLDSLNKRVLIGGAVIAVAVAYLIFTAASATGAYYMTVDDLQAQGAGAYDRRLRLGGEVMPGSIERSDASLAVRFRLGQNETSLPVLYQGITPDIFGEDVTVVVEGRYTQDGLFVADRLLAQCPSKMEAKLGAPPSRSSTS